MILLDELVADLLEPPWKDPVGRIMNRRIVGTTVVPMILEAAMTSPVTIAIPTTFTNSLAPSLSKDPRLEAEEVEPLPWPEQGLAGLHQLKPKQAEPAVSESRRTS